MAITEGDTPARPCVCARMEATQSCPGGRRVVGSHGQAGRQGHSSALAPWMLSIPVLPGCPLHLGLDGTHGNTRQMDLFSPSFIPYFLIQRIRCSSSTGGFFSCCPLSMKARCARVAAEGMQGTQKHLELTQQGWKATAGLVQIFSQGIPLV